jgi:hypothetical protein
MTNCGDGLDVLSVQNVWHIAFIVCVHFRRVVLSQWMMSGVHIVIILRGVP